MMNASDFIELYENYIGDTKQLPEQTHELIIREEWQTLLDTAFQMDQFEVFKLCFLMTPVTFCLSKIEEITRHARSIFACSEVIQTKWKEEYLQKAKMGKFIHECKIYCKYHYIDKHFYYYFNDVYRTEERVIQLFSMVN